MDRRRLTTLAALFGFAVTGLACLPVIGLGVFGVMDASEEENRPPQLFVASVVPPPASTSVDFTLVPIDVTVIDPDDEPVMLEMEYSLDGGTNWNPGDLDQDQIQATGGAGVTETVHWRYAYDLGNTNFQPDVAVRITPRDATTAGARQTTNVFYWGNDAPLIENVRVDGQDDPDGVAGTVVVRFDVFDDGEEVTLTEFAWSVTGDFNTDERIVPIETGEGSAFPVGSPRGRGTAAGEPYNLGWQSNLAVSVFTEDCVLRLKATDAYGMESTYAYATGSAGDGFVLDNQSEPVATITFIKPSFSARRSGPIELVFEVEDAEADIVDVALEWSLNGTSWLPCTTTPRWNASGTQALASHRPGDNPIEHRVYWDSLSDLPAVENNVRLRISANDGWKPGRETTFPFPIGAGPNPTARVIGFDLFGFLTRVEDVGLTDANADGAMDLIYIPRSAPDTVVVGRGGDGANFPMLISFAFVNTYTGISVLDRNGDGIDDFVLRGPSSIAVCNSTGGTAPYFTTQEIGFAAGTGQSGGYGDFNADDVPDLVLMRGSDVMVFMGRTGDNLFDTPIVTPVGSTVDEIAVVDANGDDWDDIVLIGPSSILFVYEGDGAGGFTSGATMSATNLPLKLRSADFTGDGTPEAGVLTRTGTVEIFGFTGPQPTRLASRRVPIFAQSDTAFELADIDGNGTPDIVTGTFDRIEYASVQAYGEAVVIQSPQSQYGFAYYFEHIFVGDVTGDGLADIGALTLFSDVSVFQGTDTWLGAGIGGRVSVVSAPLDFAIGDLNTDGVPDFVVAEDNTTVGVYLGEGIAGQPLGEYRSSLSVPFSAKVERIEVADMNNDGVLDIVCAVPDASEIVILYGGVNSVGIGAAEFGQTNSTTISMPSTGLRDFHIEDFDANGFLDVLVVIGGAPDLFQIYEQSSGVFAPASTIVQVPDGIGALAIGDLNHDGRPDVAVAPSLSTSNVGARVFLHRGDAMLPLYASADSFDWGQFISTPRSLYILDVDNDGIRDLVLNANAAYVGYGRVPDGDPSLLTGRIGLGMGNNGNHPIDMNADGVVDFVALYGNFFVPRMGRLGQNGDRYSTEGYQSTVFSAVYSQFRAHDLNLDGIADYAYLDGADSIGIYFGDSPARRRTRVALSVEDTIGTNVLRAGRDSFDRPYENGLYMTRWHGPTDGRTAIAEAMHPFDRHLSFYDLLLAAERRNPTGTPVVANRLLPLTRAWNVEGTERLITVPAATDGDPPRYRFESAFGPLLDPAGPRNGPRAGLNLVTTNPVELRGIVIELPVADEAPLSVNASDIRLYRLVQGWVEAVNQPGDMLNGTPQGTDLLPLTANADGTMQTRLRPTWTWELVPLDNDGNLATIGGQTGPRFVYDATAGTVRVLTDGDGVYQAFVE